jgi:hypothetical protein
LDQIGDAFESIAEHQLGDPRLGRESRSLSDFQVRHAPELSDQVIQALEQQPIGLVLTRRPRPTLILPAVARLDAEPLPVSTAGQPDSPLHGDEEVPKVDFEKEVVLVAAGPGPNILKVGELKLSDEGNLKFDWSITERGGDGFVATIVKVKREGVMTVNGEPLPEE